MKFVILMLFYAIMRWMLGTSSDQQTADIMPVMENTKYAALNDRSIDGPLWLLLMVSIPGMLITLAYLLLVVRVTVAWLRKP